MNVQKKSVLPFYFDIAGIVQMDRCEISATLNYESQEGIVKNVVVNLDLLRADHQLIKEVRVEPLASGEKRIHFTLYFPDTFGGRPTKALRLTNFHIIDKNLNEITEPTSIHINSKD